MAGIKLDSNTTRNKAGKWPRIKLYKNKGRSKAGNSANNYLRKTAITNIVKQRQKHCETAMKKNTIKKSRKYCETDEKIL